jgi:hypothetical protein
MDNLVESKINANKIKGKICLMNQVGWLVVEKNMNSIMAPSLRS